MVSDRSSPYDKAVAVPGHVHVREVADELVILSLESEQYFGLDAVGTRIWTLLVSEPTVRAALDALLLEFDVDEATLAADLEKLLDELASRNLIELVDAGSSRALDV